MCTLLFRLPPLKLKAQCLSSGVLEPTDQLLTIMNKLKPKFNKAGPIEREILVDGTVNNIERAWAGDAEFDRDRAKFVCELTAKLGYSQMSLDCL